MRARWTAVAAASVALVGVGCGDDGEDAEKQSFTLIERETDDFGFNDNPPRTEVGEEGPERLSAGDQLTFRSDLIRSGDDVGDLLAKCTVLSGSNFGTAQVTCEGTYELGGDSLTAQVGGRVFGDERLEGAITGGTGKYSGAGGTFLSGGEAENGDTRTRFEIRVPEDD